MRPFYRFIGITAVILTLSLFFLPNSTSANTDTPAAKPAAAPVSANSSGGSVSWSQGGGGVVGDGKMIYGFGILIDANGFIYDNLEYVSFDNLANLKIAYGTIALTKAGNPLKTFNLNDMAEPDKPQDGAVLIGAEYDFEPEGATFSPGVPLTITYYPDTFPEDITEDMLSIGLWDEATEAYIPLASTLDVKKHEITTVINHFSRYAIIAVPLPEDTAAPDTITPQTNGNSSHPVTTTNTISPGTAPVNVSATPAPPPALTPTVTSSSTLNPEVVENIPASTRPAETTTEKNVKITTTEPAQATTASDVNNQPETTDSSFAQDNSLALYLTGGCLLVTAVILIVIWRKRTQKS